MCLAVYLDFFASAVFFFAVLCGTHASFPEATAACFVRTVRLLTGYFDFASGTKPVFVIHTGCCGTC